MPQFEVLATIQTSRYIEAEDLETAQVLVGLLDEWELAEEWDYRFVDNVEVFPTE